VILPVTLRAVVFAVALATVPAFAQPSPAPSSEPNSPSQVGTPGAPIPPSQFAAARALVIASGLSRSFQGTVSGLTRQLAATVTSTRPDLTADLNIVLQQLAPEFDQQSDAMINDAARIYASAMTEQDLKDSVDFFNSPVGKRYVDSEPLIITNVDAVMTQWSQEVSRDMMDRVRAEMEKKGHDF
jgi:hypothetical protein